MLIHLIFDSNDLDNDFVGALQNEGHKVDVSANYSIASRDIIKADSKPDVIICSDNAFEGSINDKYDYLSVYLQEIRQNASKARVILVSMKQPTLEFIQECKDLKVELKIGGELDIDLSPQEPTEQSISTYNGAGDISVLLAVPDSFETRIRSIHKVNVVAKAKTREELEEKSTLLVPDVIVTTFDIPGEDDMIMITKRIPNEIRIIMFEPEDMNIMVHDRLVENGVEFLQDMSVEALENIIVKNSLESDIEKEKADKAEKSKNSKPNTKKKTPRGRRINFNIDRIVEGTAGGFSNVSSIFNEAGQSVSSVAKNFKLSVKSKVDKLENVIAICSPVPAGKSFVSANLSVKLVELGYAVTLIDLSTSQAQHTYFKMDIDEDCLKKAIEMSGKGDEDYESLVFEPKNLKGLSVFACDPDVKVKYSSSGVIKLIKNASETSDYVIIDMPQVSNGGFSSAVLSAAALTFIVSDMDMAHISILNRFQDFENIENKALIINKYLQSGGINIAQIKNIININQDKIFTIPCKYNVTVQSIYSGVPAACFDSDIATAFLNLADFIESNMVIHNRSVCGNEV